MKNTRLLYYLLVCFFAMAFYGCSDPGAVIDNNTALPNKVWSYNNRIGYNFKIDDAIIMKRAIENKNWKMSDLVDQSLMALSVKEFIFHVESLAPDFYKVERINLYM